MYLGIAISLLVLILAFVVKYMATEVIEDMNIFLIVAGCFLLVYVTAAIALQFIVPPVDGPARIASLFEFSAVLSASPNGF